LAAPPGAQLDQGGLPGLLAFELRESLVQGQQVEVRPGARRFDVGQLFARVLAAGLEGSLMAGAFHDDAPHRLGRGGEEVATAVPALGRLRVHQPEISLVDEVGRLESLPRLFLRESLRRQPVELIIDQRQELIRGVWVAVLDSVQGAGDLGHGPSV
jgi:hypothetical protein